MDALPRRERRHHRKPAAAAYGDVFGGPPRFGAAGPPPLDYAEVFGGSCSIPYLDLPPVAADGGFFPGRGRGGGGAGDYGEIFGRFSFADVAAPYEELFGGRKETHAPPPPPPAAKQAAPVEEDHEGIASSSGSSSRSVPSRAPLRPTARSSIRTCFFSLLGAGLDDRDHRGFRFHLSVVSKCASLSSLLLLV